MRGGPVGPDRFAIETNMTYIGLPTIPYGARVDSHTGKSLFGGGGVHQGDASSESISFSFPTYVEEHEHTQTM